VSTDFFNAVVEVGVEGDIRAGDTRLGDIRVVPLGGVPV
jgi:hypothetical protein